jgi:hypothetical protein
MSDNLSEPVISEEDRKVLEEIRKGINGAPLTVNGDAAPAEVPVVMGSRADS